MVTRAPFIDPIQLKMLLKRHQAVLSAIVQENYDQFLVALRQFNDEAHIPAHVYSYADLELITAFISTCQQIDFEEIMIKWRDILHFPLEEAEAFKALTLEVLEIVNE